MNALTETGMIALATLLVGFLLKCCQQIEQSRCSHINCWGVKCDRTVLSEETIVEMNRNETEQKV